MISKPNTVTVGVLSDTHLPYRMDRLPDQIHQAFQDVDLILHAGDVDRIEYLDGLTSLAPLHAVRGNPHFKDFSDGGRDLPVEWQLTIAGHSVVVNHGGWPGFWSQAGDWFVQYLLRPGQDVLNQRIANRLAQIYPQANLIVFGHSHRPYQTWHNRTLIFNPGAVCPTRRQVPSVGKVYLGPGTVEAEIISLV
jgi:predicted phosphodiesterase